MHASRGKLFSKCLLNVKMKCLIIKRKFQTKYPTKNFFSLLLTFQNGNHNKSFDFLKSEYKSALSNRSNAKNNNMGTVQTIHCEREENIEKH